MGISIRNQNKGIEVRTLNHLTIPRLLLTVFAAITCAQAQPQLRNNGIADGPPGRVLPQNALLHAQFNNPYQAIENFEKLILSAVPERLVPPDLKPLMDEEHPLLTLLGMQTVQAPLTQEQIRAMTGLGIDRPLTLTFYLGEPGKSFIVSLPVDDFDAFSGFLEKSLKIRSFESVSVGGKTFVKAGLKTPWLQTIYLAGSADRVYLSGSESLLMLLYPGATDLHLADSPLMRNLKDITSKNDLWLTFNPNLLKPFAPQLEFFKYIPLNMLISKRAELLQNIPPDQKAMIDMRLRLQLGVNGLEEFSDYVECFLSATYEELYDLVVTGIRSFNGISLGLKLDSAFPRASFYLHSDSLQADASTRPIPLGDVRDALRRIPGTHRHISITGQTPTIGPSPRITSWLSRLKAGIEAKKLNPNFVIALQKIHLETLHAQPVSSRVPWTLQTSTSVNPPPLMGDFSSLEAYGNSLSDRTGQPITRFVTITPRQQDDVLEQSLRQKITAYEQNTKLVNQTLFPKHQPMQLIDKVYRLKSRTLDRGVKEQTWETAFVSRGGLFGFNQHELISRSVYYTRNVGDWSIFHQASGSPGWIEQLQPLASPQANKGLERLLDQVPNGANSLCAHRFLAGLPDVINTAADFEALLHRDVNGYLTRVRSISRETPDKAEFTRKIQSIQFPPLVQSINRNPETGDVYCLLPGGIVYPRPAVLPHLVRLFSAFSEHADDFGGLLCYTRVEDGTYEGSIVPSTESLANLIRLVGNSLHEQLLSTPNALDELRDQVWMPQDRDPSRLSEIILKNPALEFLPIPGQPGAWGTPAPKTEPKISVTIAPRASATPKRQIDLTNYYNASMNETWQVGGLAENDLKSLPQGNPEFCGVPFDVRGIVQLTGNSAEEQLSVKFPQKVPGIAVNQNASKLHALHACAWTETDGNQIGSFVLHYEDGETRELPIIYGKHVRDWWTPANTPATTDSQVAWKGANTASSASQIALQIYKTTWDNPRPEVAISTIDYVSSRSQAAPYLIAITLE